MGVPYNLRTINLAKEVTFGTPVSGTVRVMNLLDAGLKVDDETIVIPEIGRLNPSATAAQVYQGGLGNYKTVLSYEDAPYDFDALFGLAVPSTASGSPYNWAYTGPTTAVPTSPRIQTVEFGASGASYKLSGGVLQKWSLHIESMGLAEVNREFTGYNISTVQLSTGVADRSVNIIRSADVEMYVDSASGTLGTTIMSASIIDVDVEIDTKRHTKPFLGSLNPGAWGEGGPWALTFKTTVEFNTTGKALHDALLSGMVQRQVRLLSTGPSTGQIMTLNMGLTQTGGVDLFSERNGNITTALTFSGWYSSGIGNWITVSDYSTLFALA